MRRLLLLVRPAWSRLAGAVGLATLSLACGVALLAVSAWLITRAAFMPPVLTLMVAIVGVRAFGIGRGVFRYLERLVAHDAALRSLVDIRVRLYRPLEQLAPAVYWRSGDLLQRLSADVDAIADVLIRGWVPVLSAGIVLAGSVGVLVWLLPAAGLVGGIAVVIAATVALLAARRRARLSTDLADRRSERVAVVTETVQATADPAVLVDGRWRARLAAVDVTEFRLAGRIGSWDGLAAAVGVLATGGAALGCWLVGRDAGLSGETLTVVTLLPLALLDVVAMLPAAFDHLQRADRLSARLAELLDAGTAEEPSPVAPEPPVLVTVRDLAVSWPGRDVPALTGVDLDLAPGRRIAVVGPSGSGKSTLLDALLGFAPSTGILLLNGEPDPHADRRAAMSLCDQEAYLFDSTVAENVRLARAGARDDEVGDALRRARLGPWIDALPDGMNTRVGHLGTMVSGGQRQRIAYARALLADRPILLLDEPTAGLDAETGAALVADLLDVGSEVCVVLVTHETALLDGFDQVLTLGRGKPVAIGHAESPKTGDDARHHAG
jgi:ATP-binding cassette, subfamily C, bacterial CydC